MSTEGKMDDKERTMHVTLARRGLSGIARNLRALGRDDLADQAEKMAQQVAPTQVFEDGLYRINGDVWERSNGFWSSLVSPDQIWDDASVVAEYGLPVRVRELPEDVLAINPDLVPGPETLSQAVGVLSREQFWGWPGQREKTVHLLQELQRLSECYRGQR